MVNEINKKDFYESSHQIHGVVNSILTEGLGVHSTKLTNDIEASRFKKPAVSNTNTNTIKIRYTHASRGQILWRLLVG